MNTFKHWKQSVKLAQYEAFIYTYKWEIHLIGIHWFTHKFITVLVILRSLEFDNYVGFTYGGDEQWERIFRRSYWWDASHVQKTIRAVFFYTLLTCIFLVSIFSLLSMYVQLYVCTTLCICTTQCMYIVQLYVCVQLYEWTWTKNTDTWKISYLLWIPERCKCCSQSPSETFTSYFKQRFLVLIVNASKREELNS